MLAKNIEALEKNAHKIYEPFLKEKKVEGKTIYAFSQPNPNAGLHYYEQETQKTSIVLHFTAGFLEGDLNTLTTAGNHVSVAYVVARNGRIYQLFDPKYWSYHLGKGTVGGNEYMSSRTIGIEVSNIGPLKKFGSKYKYETSQGWFEYCDENEIEFFEDYPAGFRQRFAFAKFTEKQYASTKFLLDHLTTKFSIPRDFIDTPKRYETFENAKAARDYLGVSSHVNYRKTGKWDIGPSFEWSKIGG